MKLTADEQASFNAYQASGVMHPFTCGGDLSDVLVADDEGIYCPSCDYVQGWAHPWMLDWSWKAMSPFAVFAR
jgi:hypothetical protein